MAKTNKSKQTIKYGYIQDTEDKRDYMGLPYLKLGASKAKVDLRAGFSEVEDQKTIGSCTANAAVGILEYWEKKAYKKWLDASRLFLYRVTRNLMGLTGDSGASVRNTCKALRIFGACPESAYPYNDTDWDKEPSAYQYAYALSYQAIDYYRVTGIENIKTTLSGGIPIMFGFDVYEMPDNGFLPVPNDKDESKGGHAVVACGYDEKYLYFRNSWGKDWGDNGYGYMPWEYVERGIARDFFVIARIDFVDGII